MRAVQRLRAKHPLATISAYGSDNRRATKLVAGILRRAEQRDPNPMRSWSADAGDVRNDPLIAAELADWLRSQGVKDTVSYDRIIGCPREEGIDYPIGRTCPLCPFWAAIDRFTHEPIPAPVANMSPDEVLIEPRKDTVFTYLSGRTLTYSSSATVEFVNNFRFQKPRSWPCERPSISTIG